MIPFSWRTGYMLIIVGHIRGLLLALAVVALSCSQAAPAPIPQAATTPTTVPDPIVSPGATPETRAATPTGLTPAVAPVQAPTTTPTPAVAPTATPALSITPASTPTPRETTRLTLTPVFTPTPILTPRQTPSATPTSTTTRIITTPTPTSIPLPDTVPPPAITGLVANNAYDKRVNLWWDKSIATDFDHYNIYLNKAEMADVTGMKPIQQVKDVAASRYQATGLEDGTRYYFAITAVDKNGNEGVKVVSVSAMSAPMPRGTKDPDISVDTYQSETAWAGTTLLPDNHDGAKPRIIEVNMLGEIVWQYLVPQNLRRSDGPGAGINPGFDVELLVNNNILFVSPGNGVHEIDRKGNLIWSYSDRKVSHDADHLPNGNTLIAFGDADQKNDAQAKEINPKGETVWAWYAKDHFDKPPYNSIFDEGWTHTNAVSRLPNGNTLISLRNFNLVVEVDSKGMVVRTYGEGIFKDQHDPEMLPDGNILVANHGLPHRAIEIDPKAGSIVWQSPGFAQDNIPVRDANRLPNGNTLVTGTTGIVEVTPKGEIVWRLTLKDIVFSTRQDASGLGFYKAERIAIQR